MNRDLLRDLSAALAAALLVTTAAVIGTVLEHRYGDLHVSWPPLYGHWEPHVGPGTPAAIMVALAVVAYGPPLAARLPWRALLCTAWGTAMAWTFSLALVDGWQRGIARRLTTKYEYLQVIDPVNRFHDIPAALRDFTHHILIHSPDAWPAHVAGHPPAATLTFVLLDRIGLGGGAWAGVWCVTVGAAAAVAVLVMVRALSGEALARRGAPFPWANPACTALVVGPAAVAGPRRAGAAPVRQDVRTCLRRSAAEPRLALLVLAALLALLAADLSGMSEAETERIWLPFAMWLFPACGGASPVTRACRDVRGAAGGGAREAGAFQAQGRLRPCSTWLGRYDPRLRRQAQDTCRT
ncbi:hypothetical protein P1S61_25965 [Streptomyces sp. ME08-AFT2]|uniref:hypothetical protein n=1 Tax=Streptomyces sp. ME08-AFT2 TaxID=3028683 RepID=UPI0029B7A49A|nr:hypothetical protein [Streptomyces sp. ME08-AFT2]MDX3312459.1 hypothetical protein [Streptomyces sp. ME08-AFT2]